MPKLPPPITLIVEKHPTPEQLRRLAYLIRVEDDYINDDRFVVKFAAAVLALWGVGGYVHNYQPSDWQLSIIDAPAPGSPTL
jgi:hypothetical protein